MVLGVSQRHHSAFSLHCAAQREHTGCPVFGAELELERLHLSRVGEIITAICSAIERKK